MALRFIDGFDHYAFADITQKWSGNSGPNNTITAAGRTGANAVRLGFGGQYIWKTLDAQATWIVGFALKMGTIMADVPIVSFIDTVTTHCDLRISSSGKAYFTRNGTLIGSVGLTTIATGVFNYFEVKVTISDTVGVAALHLNGVTELNGSGLDTRNGGNATADKVYLSAFGAGSGTNNHDFDDLYICDATGTTNNDFLGDCKVELPVPTGAGTTTQLTPSAGSNWQNVDDVPNNGDTDYNSSATAGQKDTYAMSNLATTAGTVYGVQSVIVARKDDAGTRTIHAVVRSGASELNGADYGVSGGYVQYQDIFETKPGGGAWAIADVNGMEAGVTVVA